MATEVTGNVGDLVSYRHKLKKSGDHMEWTWKITNNSDHAVRLMPHFSLHKSDDTTTFKGQMSLINDVEPGETIEYTDLIYIGGRKSKYIQLDNLEVTNRASNEKQTIQVGERFDIPGCFVLTACYGNESDTTVLAFRNFRDQQLTRFAAGRRFIDWYYTHGPVLADFVSDKPKIKVVLRAIFRAMAKILPR